MKQLAPHGIPVAPVSHCRCTPLSTKKCVVLSDRIARISTLRINDTDTHKEKIIHRAFYHDDCAHVFGEKGHIAGIPICSTCTSVGARLRYTLRNRPHEFVALALQEVEDITRRPEQKQQTSAKQIAEGTPDRPILQSTSHYASIRANTEHASHQGQRSDSQHELAGILQGHGKFKEIADVLYYWALGETYHQHPQLQEDMRKCLGRTDSRPLAAGDDMWELSSRVQLLDGPFYEGCYLIGSVNFVQTCSSSLADTEETSTSGSDVSWGGDLGSLQSKIPLPLLDGVWGSENGRMLMALEASRPYVQTFASTGKQSSNCRAQNNSHIQSVSNNQSEFRSASLHSGEVGGSKEIVQTFMSLSGSLASGQDAGICPEATSCAWQGDSPTRMMRQSVARTYHMYQLWGYFQRRMALQRAGEPDLCASNWPAGSAEGWQGSRYGSPSMPWRFFENVPDHLCKLRTNEAASVAERHLRALFGSQEECITTLQAWQQMTREAKWFGRALFDAEHVVLKSCSAALAVQPP